MNAIVYDLELVKRFKKGQPSQIVEIGACKVNLSTKKITDTFQVYISPKGGYVAKSTRKFINMKKEDMKTAVSYEEGIERFKEWIGTEDYYLCSWGKDDRLHIINQNLRNKMELDWFKNYNDIQQKIGAVIRDDNTNQLGLKNALDMADIEHTGLAHRGIDDAINTGKLLVKYLDQISLQKNKLDMEQIIKSRKNRRAKYRTSAQNSSSEQRQMVNNRESK